MSKKSKKSRNLVVNVSPRTKPIVSRSKSVNATPVVIGEAVLSAAREEELTSAIGALADDEIVLFPGRLAERVRWAAGVWVSATRDADDLVRVPFFDEPDLSKEEIASFRDRIEMMRLTQSRFMVVRGVVKVATAEFQVLADEAAIHKENLLKTFTLRFRNDRAGLKRVALIRQGTGDADLVQDVSDILGLCVGHEKYLARGTNGEAVAARRLAEMSGPMVALLGKKTRDEGTRGVRRLRDGAFTLLQATERRIRAAAEYCYGGTPKMKEYAAYLPPKGAKADPEDEVGDSPSPTPAIAEPPAAPPVS